MTPGVVLPPGGWGEVTPEAILRFNGLAVRAAGVPRGGGCRSAATMACQVLPAARQTAARRRTGTRTGLKRETIEFGTAVRARPHHIDPDAEAHRPVAEREYEPRARRRRRCMATATRCTAGLRTCSPRAFGHAALM